jgi:hypothetical protein
MGELARNWITAHTYVDLGLQAVVLAVCVLLTLLAISAAFYSLWWLLRLLRPANVARFTARDIPGIRKGKLAGQELEFGEVASAESEAIRAMGQTIEELSFRLAGAERALKDLEETFERFEDVSGRA